MALSNQDSYKCHCWHSNHTVFLSAPQIHQSGFVLVPHSVGTALPWSSQGWLLLRCQLHLLRELFDHPTYSSHPGTISHHPILIPSTKSKVHDLILFPVCLVFLPLMSPTWEQELCLNNCSSPKRNKRLVRKKSRSSSLNFHCLSFSRDCKLHKTGTLPILVTVLSPGLRHWLYNQ